MAKKQNVRKCVDGLSAKGNLNWKLDGHRLTIGGNGRMRDFTDTVQPPWAALSGQVRWIVVEDGVENIGGRAFLGFENLETVRLGRDLGRIGWRAFDGCSRLTEVRGRGPLRHWRLEPEEGTVRVGYRAFRGTGLQQEMVIHEGVVLEYSGPGGAVTIPKGIREIAPYAFAHTVLESVVFPPTLERVGVGAFYATDLREVILPARIRQVEAYAFGGNPQLRKVFRGRGSAQVDPLAFDGTPVSDRTGEILGRWHFARGYRCGGFFPAENGKWSAGELHQALRRGAVLLMVEPGADGRFDIRSCCCSYGGEYVMSYTLWPCLSRWGICGEQPVHSENAAAFRQNRERERTWISIYGDNTVYLEQEEVQQELRYWKFCARRQGAKLYISRDRGNFQGPLELSLCEKWLSEHPEAWIN